MRKFFLFSLIFIVMIGFIAGGCSKPAPTSTPVPATALTLTSPPTNEMELKYDDGTALDFLSAGTQGGFMVDFQAPVNPFTVNKVRLFGMTAGDISTDSFEVEIWDKDRKVVYNSNQSITKFSYETPTWVEIDIPNVEVVGKFYIHVFTGTGRTGGIFMGAYNQNNLHSTVTIRGGGITMESAAWTYRSGFWFSDRSKVNWMIRVVGIKESLTSTPAPSPTTNPTSTPPGSLVNISGSWIGLVNTNVSGEVWVVLTLQQNGTSISGGYSSSKGALGSISGTISGNTANLIMTIIYPEGCSGSFSGTGSVDNPQSNQPTITFNYSGSSTCGGEETGSGNLQKRE